MAPPVDLPDPSQHHSFGSDDVLPPRLYANKRADHLTKVLVIGAGPQALAFVLRFRTRDILERTPDVTRTGLALREEKRMRQASVHQWQQQSPNTTNQNDRANGAGGLLPGKAEQPDGRSTGMSSASGGRNNPDESPAVVPRGRGKRKKKTRKGRTSELNDEDCTGCGGRCAASARTRPGTSYLRVKRLDCVQRLVTRGELVSRTFSSDCMILSSTTGFPAAVEYGPGNDVRMSWMDDIMCPYLGELDSETLMVVDEYGTWMERWRQQFAGLRIEWLRSLVTAHPHPYDEDALLSFAYANGLADQVKQVDLLSGLGVRQRRSSKGATSDFNVVDDYRLCVPSSRVFLAFCESLIERYRLTNIVYGASATDVEHIVPKDGPAFFRVRLSDGTFVHANRVVAAIGNTNQSRVPSGQEERFASLKLSDRSTAHIFDQLHTYDCCSPETHSDFQQRSQVTGAASILKATQEEPMEDGASIAGYMPGGATKGGASAIVVGGGLTAAQVAVSLVEEHEEVDRVFMLCRAAFKVRPFDVASSWVGRNRHLKLAEFWSQGCPAARRELLLRARNGGSVPPEYFRERMVPLMTSGRLVLLENAKVAEDDMTCCAGKAIDEGLERFVITGKAVSVTPDRNGKMRPATDECGMTSYHVTCLRVTAATGAKLDATTEPLFRNLMASNPIKTHGGLPELTPDLKWRDDVNFYVMGGYAQLQVGPEAPNLNGGRIASTIIVEDMWDSGLCRVNGCKAANDQPKRCRSVTADGEEGSQGGRGNGRREARVPKYEFRLLTNRFSALEAEAAI